jgi:hypothetical protein
MKKIIGLISLLALSITNSFAGVVSYSRLSETEQEFIVSNLDNSLIKYDASTDEVVIDNSLEAQLRKSGILQTQDAHSGHSCVGGGSTGGV